MNTEKENLKNQMNKQIADLALKEIDRLDKQVKILQKVLHEAGKYARENLPAVLPEDINYTTKCIVDGASDPEGMRFISYWLELATKKGDN